MNRQRSSREGRQEASGRSGMPGIPSCRSTTPSTGSRLYTGANLRMVSGNMARFGPNASALRLGIAASLPRRLIHPSAWLTSA
ncbi:hypothetical protein RHECNPAF_730036 [Rhizobium etli CNPAF512]|nr:hypothetical protein RHECNPAF_730036 [Rhizobium etli CNPAF512]